MIVLSKRSRFRNSSNPILANTDRFCKPVTTEDYAHLQDGNDCSVLQWRWQLVMLLPKYIVCIINKYMLKIPLMICVSGRNKSYVCLQLSLLGVFCVKYVDVRLVTQSH